MAAGNLDLMMEQGGNFNLTLNVYDKAGVGYDMIGWNASMKIIHRASGVVTLIGSGVGTLVISGSTIVIAIPHAAVSGLDAEDTDYTPRQIRNRDTKYAYEVSITNGVDIKKIVRGNLFVARGIG